jgi:WD40 repeat protein
MIAIGDAGGHVVIWSLEGSQVKELSCHDGKTGALAFSPDGRLLASAGSDDGVVSITELESGAFIHRFPTYSTTPATFEQVHPGTGKTWCALVGKHPVGTLAITPGNEVVIAGVSCSCFEGRVWDVASERERHPVKSFREFHLSEDGRRIVIEDNHEIYVYPLDAFIR